MDHAVGTIIPSTAICQVIHSDYTWEYVLVGIGIVKADYAGQMEQSAARDAVAAVKAKPTYEPRDVVRYISYYYNDEPGGYEFFDNRLGLSTPNPHARIL